ncbi:hypothetical protein FKW77_007130 [Venturia effusa]|uniref:Uncharacterized protein n=1 Tax=Venturia effusa TaxID=50376 RepID=A0A517LKG4_9PEZI|nr:hypothetical protein FKW77_007130 [Venturia effusa]
MAAPPAPKPTSQAHFEFVWPRPRIDDGKIFLSDKATQFPCGGLTKALKVRTPFPLSGNVPIQLRLKNWNAPDAPRKVTLKVKMNLGNNAGVGEFKAGQNVSPNSGAKNDPHASQKATEKVNKDFEFKTGLRSMSETFIAGGGLCLQDIWAPHWAGHSDMGKVDQLKEGMNATLLLEVAETEAPGGKEVVRRGYMCADITFTKEPLTHHQYAQRCYNDSTIVPHLASNTDTFPLIASPTPLIAGPPHHPNPNCIMGVGGPVFGSDCGPDRGPDFRNGGGLGGLFGGVLDRPHGPPPTSSPMKSHENVGAKVGAAVGGSVAAVVLFFLVWLLVARKKLSKKNRSTAFANSDVEQRPSPEELFAANRITPATTGAGLRGGEGDAASQDGFEAAERREQEEGVMFGNVRVKFEEVRFDEVSDEGSVFGDEKRHHEENLPSYGEAAGKGRDMGREKY